MSREWGFNQTGARLIYALQSPATQIADTTSEGLLVPNVSIPANYFRVGKVIRATLNGTSSCVVTTPGTLILRARWGGLTGTEIVNGGTMAQNIVAQTTVGWWWVLYLTCIAEGSAGQIQCAGTSHRRACAAAAVGDITPDIFPPSDSASFYSAPPAVDLTAETALSFTAKFSVNTSGTNIQCYSYILEALN